MANTMLKAIHVQKLLKTCYSGTVHILRKPPSGRGSSLAYVSQKLKKKIKNDIAGVQVPHDQEIFSINFNIVPKKELTSAGIEPESPPLAVRNADHSAIRLRISKILLYIYQVGGTCPPG